MVLLMSQYSLLTFKFVTLLTDVQDSNLDFTIHDNITQNKLPSLVMMNPLLNWPRISICVNDSFLISFSEVQSPIYNWLPSEPSPPWFIQTIRGTILLRNILKSWVMCPLLQADFNFHTWWWDRNRPYVMVSVNGQWWCSRQVSFCIIFTPFFFFLL